MFDAYLGPYEGHWHVLRNGISKLRLVKGCVIIGKGEHEVIGEKICLLKHETMYMNVRLRGNTLV